MEVASTRGVINMTTVTKIEDERYTVTPELTGHDNRWFVARFEHHWVGEAPTEAGAWDIACQHARGRG